VLLPLLLAALTLRPPVAQAQSAAGYAARDGAGRSGDTLRARAAGERGEPRRSRTTPGAPIAGYLSTRGLPPVPGVIAVTDTSLVFRPADGRRSATLPPARPVRDSRARRRMPRVSLAYVDRTLGRPSYLFRVDGGVFETDAPGMLMDLARHPPPLDSVAAVARPAERPLVDGRNAAAVRGAIGGLMEGAYADTLYGVFGRPSRPVGVVGERGRAAGRLGEYVSARDSLALDPARMTSVDQLRHTLAHELAHRWQAHAPGTIATLWRDVPPIRDPKRYGYASTSEQQAEAAAFAIHFLLATAADAQPAGQLVMLDHYDLLVPGTRLLARYFALQPAFRSHPLRRLLTSGTAK